VPKGKGLIKIYKVSTRKIKSCAKKKRFIKEELEVVPKGKGLTRRYRFSQEKLEVVPKGKGLATNS